MKHTYTVKKETKTSYESKILKKNNYTHYVVIPAKVMQTLNLSKDDIMQFDIEEISMNQIGCDISFKAGHLQDITDDTSKQDDTDDKNQIETASTTGAPMTKTVEIKTHANNENKPRELKGLPITIDKYLIHSAKTPYDSIEVRDTKANVRDTYIGISKRTDENIESLIKELSACENIDQIHKVLFQYRKRP